MAETVACDVLGHTYTSGTLGGFNTNATGYAGKGGSYYYTYFLKFTVPEFTGVPGEMEFGLYLTSSFASGHTFRAAIVSRLDNASRYINATAPVGEVADEYQLAAGMTPTFENLTSYPKYYTFRLDGSKLRAGETYYLVMWASTVVGIGIQSTVSTYGNATAVLAYEPGVVRLDTGAEVIPVVVYLDNGLEMLRVMPCVDTGSGWCIGS